MDMKIKYKRTLIIGNSFNNKHSRELKSYDQGQVVFASVHSALRQLELTDSSRFCEF